MSTEMPKAYDPTAVQAEVAAVWENEKLFHAEPTDPGEPYSVVIPPPNVTAALHLGHALNNTIQDVLIRKARMEGKNAVWLPGTDHAGIATQTVVEKRVLNEEGRRRTDFRRDEFVKKIQAWKDEYEQVILGQLKAMGCSCDWDRTAFTMDAPRAKAVREAFFQLFKAGLIYRGKRLVNWDPATQTALADDEVEMEEVDGFFYYLKYPVYERDGDNFFPPQEEHKGMGTWAPLYVTVATTRPETMLGDTAVAVNPTDSRAASLRGKYVKLPIVNRYIPIIEDDYVVKSIDEGGDPADVKAQFASGFLKVTPAHDPNDYEIGQRHSLPVINVMAPDGSISNQHGWSQLDGLGGVGEAGFLLGLSREAAREAVVEWFRRHGLLEAAVPYRHSVGHSYRSHVPIEPYLSDQWYCRVTDERLAGAALRALSTSSPSPLAGEGGVGGSSVGKSPEAGNPSPHPLPQGEGEKKADTVTFYPGRYAKTYQTWNENIRDWCISRQLWWGHRIPVWTLQSDVRDATGELIWNEADVGGLLSTWIKEVGIEKDVIVISTSGAVPAFNICTRTAQADAAVGELARVTYMANSEDDEHYGRKSSVVPHLVQVISSLEQDPDVLDTWFSSALWPLSTLGWPAANAAPLTKWNPTTVLTTAREIITLWVSRMVMFNQFFLGQVPFRDVFIHAMIQDGDGRKMSKSLGNGVDPLDIIHSHGADAMRFTLASMCTQTQDVRMPVERDPATGRNTSPKFDIGRNFANKVWNGARFVIGQIAALQNGESASGRVVADGGVADVGVAASAAMSSAPDFPSANQTAKVLTLADLWILSRLNRTIDEANDALAGYRFDQYAKACYDFFWRDFCDWYVEAAKPQMKDPTRQASTARVLASVLDASMRLLHPVMPFVTEKIWWQLNEVAPERGVMGRINCPPSQRCIKAQWPRRGELAEAAEQIFEKIQEIVVAIRTLRSDYKIDARKSVAVSIKSGEEAAHGILSLKASIELLAVCTIRDVGEHVASPDNATAVQAGGCEVYVEGLVDPAAEAQRVAKRKDELTKAVAALKGRLNNAGYLAKAPPHLVKQTQDQLTEAEAELASLG
ncbi:MAG TPA: valine--tRNA ligase [Tepidisphaeraceae bacterium]|jgi:valyl-tRNA synthetase